MAINASSLRMGGINSGLDTEAIVTAMSAATKLKITTNQRKILKLEAQQSSYRGIIDKMTTLKSKYFDMLNSSTCLTSATNLNRFSSTVRQEGIEKSIAGVSVSSNHGAKEGTYSVRIEKTAEQAKVSSETLGSKQSFNIEDFDDGETYTMSVTVGSTEKYITFSGTDKDAILTDINNQLKEAFGKKNDGNGIVTLKETAVNSGLYTFNASDKSTITTSAISKLETSENLTADFETGKNSITVVIDGEAKSIEFSTIDEDYFKELFYDKFEDGSYSDELSTDLDENGFVKGADKDKIALFKDVAQEMFITQQHSEYETWQSSNTGDGWVEDISSYEDLLARGSAEQKDLFNAEVDRRNDERREKYLNNALMAEYEKFDKEQRASGKTSTDDDYVWYDDWLKDIQVGYGIDASETDPDNTGETIWNKEVAFDLLKEKIFSDETFEAGGLADTDEFAKKFEKAHENYVGGRIEEEDKATLFKASYDEYTAYKNNIYEGITEKDFIAGASKVDSSNYVSAEEAARVFNENAVKLNLEDIRFSDGTRLNVTVKYQDDDPSTNIITGYTVEAFKYGTITETIDGKEIEKEDKSNKITQSFNILADSANASDFGLDPTKTIASTVSQSTKLSELNIEPNEDGKYTFEINGQKFSFTNDTTIKEMMATVNANEEAGVKMTFSTLSNSFEISSLKYGSGASITYEDGEEGLLSALGFNELGEDETITGHNMVLDINNGQTIETDSNSYTIDGTTFTISSTAVEGTEFEVEVKRDTSALKDLIKSFIKDYNEMIDHVFGMVSEKPNKDYYFLTDDDREEMELSDKQEEMWDTAAKKGILYNDSTVIDVMARLRMSLMGSVTGMDGKAFSLYSLGITTSSDYKDRGKLQFYNGKESYLDEALVTNFDDIVKLFTDSENGVFTKFANQLDFAAKTTGAKEDKGILVQKAGLAGGNSTEDNLIFDQIKSLNKLITSLESRYEKQQDRYWSIFTSLEKQMGTLNGQTSYINQLMGM